MQWGTGRVEWNGRCICLGGAFKRLFPLVGGATCSQLAKDGRYARDAGRPDKIIAGVEGDPDIFQTSNIKLIFSRSLGLLQPVARGQRGIQAVFITETNVDHIQSSTRATTVHSVKTRIAVS